MSPHAPLAVLTAALLAGCGYSVGYADYGGAGRRVALHVAGNRTLRQRLELPLTRALQEQLPVHTGFVPVGPEDAEAILEVEIVDVGNRSMAGPGRGPLQRGVPVREGAVEYAVAARLRDAATGRVLRETRVLDRAELRIAVGETEASAVDEASFDLARKIVLGLEEW